MTALAEEINGLNAIRNVEILRAVDRINQDYDRQIAALFNPPAKPVVQFEPVPFGMRLGMMGRIEVS